MLAVKDNGIQTSDFWCDRPRDIQIIWKLTVFCNCAGFFQRLFIGPIHSRESSSWKGCGRKYFETAKFIQSKIGGIVLFDGTNVKQLQSDVGSKYTENSISNWLKSKGTAHEIMIANFPGSHGVAERLNRTLLTMAHAMMINCQDYDNSLWAEAVVTGCFIRNRLATASSKIHSTSYKISHGKERNSKFLKMFGSTAFVSKPARYCAGRYDDCGWKDVQVGNSRRDAYHIFLPLQQKGVAVTNLIVQETDLRRHGVQRNNKADFELTDNLEKQDDPIQKHDSAD